MNTLDATLVLYINGLAGRSEVLDRFISGTLLLPSIKLLPIVAALIALWSSDRAGGRAAVWLAMAAGFVALVVSRIAQNLGPYRPRPLHDETLGFTPPYGADIDALREWSSFLSDHAALSFARAAAVWTAWRWLGAACLTWAAAVVCLTRVYTGFHYPSDIAAGALIAILVVAAGAKLRVGQRVEPMMARLERRAPALFAGAAFIVLFQVVTMFNDARALARSAASVLPGGA